jgi:hypothetical protein
VVKVEVNPGEVDALIHRGYLEPKDRHDPEFLAGGEGCETSTLRARF